MRFALRAHSTNEDRGAELALVSVDAKTREGMLKRRAMWLAVKAYDSDLSYMEFWDYSPDWYEYPELEDEASDLVADEEVVPNFQFAVKGEALRMDCVRAIVDEQGVHWCGWIKHTSIRCDTSTIPWALLEDKK
jgi:hypothetical protein